MRTFITLSSLLLTTSVSFAGIIPEQRPGLDCPSADEVHQAIKEAPGDRIKPIQGFKLDHSEGKIERCKNARRLHGPKYRPEFETCEYSSSRVSGKPAAIIPQRYQCKLLLKKAPTISATPTIGAHRK